jgi:hypothetical protein
VPRKPRRPKSKWVVWAVVVAGFLLYRAIIYTPDIVDPSPWHMSSSAGLHALEAGRLDEAEQHFLAARRRRHRSDRSGAV